MKKLFLLFCIVLFTGCGATKKTYTIGIDPSWYPEQLMGIEDNVLAFSIELLVEIAKREKLALATLEKSWDNLVEDLEKTKYDAILSSMRPYTFYEKTFSFSDLYIKNGPVIVVPLSSSIRSVSGLKAKEVGVVQGSSSTILLQKIPGLILKPFANSTLTLHAVRTQQVQAGSVPVLIAQRFVSDIYSDALRITTPPLDEEGLRLITLHNASPHLMDRFNRGLNKLQIDGTYDYLLDKWGLAPNSKAPSSKAIKAFIHSHLK